MSDEAGRLIVFSLGGERYALPLTDIGEVMETEPLYPVPRVPPFFLGAINFHGRVVPVLDLASFLGERAASRDGTFLVLDDWIGSLALRVDGVEGIVSPHSLLEEDEGDGGLVARVVTAADGEMKVLDSGRLVESLEKLITDQGGEPWQSQA